MDCGAVLLRDRGVEVNVRRLDEANGYFKNVCEVDGRRGGLMTFGIKERNIVAISVSE